MCPEGPFLRRLLRLRPQAVPGDHGGRLSHQTHKDALGDVLQENTAENDGHKLELLPPPPSSSSSSSSLVPDVALQNNCILICVTGVRNTFKCWFCSPLGSLHIYLTFEQISAFILGVGHIKLGAQPYVHINIVVFISFAIFVYFLWNNVRVMLYLMSLMAYWPNKLWCHLVEI